MHKNSVAFEEQLRLAVSLKSEQRFDEALVAGEKALQMCPDHPGTIALTAGLRGRMRDLDGALELLTPILSGRSVPTSIALAYGRLSLSLKHEHNAIDVLERTLAAIPADKTMGRYGIHFCLGDLYDSIGQYDSAFANYEKANEKKPVPFEQTSCINHFNSIIKNHQLQGLDALPSSTVDSSRQLFIVGMPRSGTSLVEQILDSHPDVCGLGELPLIGRFVKSLPALLNTDQPYPDCMAELTQDVLEIFARQYQTHTIRLNKEPRHIVDKMPGNFQFLGLIQALFPGSRIIHCRRDPLDTCLSCYFHEFNASHNYSTELRDLGVFYLGYQRLMEHWSDALSLPLLELDYETLIQDTERVCRELLKFCGLDWNDQCLLFYENARDVGTASHEQVRNPISAVSIGRWKNYRRHLEPLREALDMPWPVV